MVRRAHSFLLKSLKGSTMCTNIIHLSWNLRPKMEPLSVHCTNEFALLWYANAQPIQFNSRFFLYDTQEIHFDHSNKSFCRVLWLQMTIKIEYPTWVCVYALYAHTVFFDYILTLHKLARDFRFGIIKSTKYTRQLSLLWIWPTRCVGYRAAACTFLISGKQFTTVMINR